MFGQGRLELIEQLTTPDVADHGAPPENEYGRDGLERTIRWLHSGFDNLAYTPLDVFAERRQGHAALHSVGFGRGAV
jgi:hypothetical protein